MDRRRATSSTWNVSAAADAFSQVVAELIRNRLYEEVGTKKQITTRKP